MNQLPRTTLGKTFYLLKGIHIHPAYLLVPIVLSIAAATFEGASLGLLIPLLNGFLQQDFSFIKEAPYIGEAIMQLPLYILDSDKLLFATLLFIFVVSVLLKNTLKFLAAVSITYFSERTLHHLRKVLFSRYLQFGKLYFDRSTVGHHATVLTEFARMAVWPLMTINKHMNALFSLMIYLVIMGMISWKLTFIAIPLFGLLHLSVRTIIRKIRVLSSYIAERGSELGRKSYEILSTIPLVKSYCTENLEKNHYSAISDEKAKLDFKSNSLKHLMLPLQESITLLSAVMLFAGMLYLMVRDQVAAAPSFIVYFYLVLNASAKFGTLSGFRGALATASSPLDEVLEVMNDEGKYYVQGGGTQYKKLANEIEFRNVQFSYPDGRSVLQDLSFTVNKGEMTAIVGPTGSGKTTIINLIMRYYDCPEKSIFIDGTDIRDFNLESILRSVALVSQETLLINDTLRNNICYGLSNISDDQIAEVLKRSRLESFVQDLPNGLETFIGDRGVMLSGGEKQRVSIARALLKDADILILDEATSSLDSTTEKLIQDAVDEAIKDRTAIVIAHRLSTIQNAHKIVVVENGSCVEQGPMDVLIKKKGVFSGLWQEQKF